MGLPHTQRLRLTLLRQRYALSLPDWGIY
ncbi:hypothetical protein SPHINGOAX6_40287 [Sphingomonas sp. AX6]|nr:hypothetical protein SPHINGOAX6_40287 [Sphingomonas sp. AX6]